MSFHIDCYCEKKRSIWQILSVDPDPDPKQQKILDFKGKDVQYFAE